MDEVADLRADCARCSALCCVALPYAASADFAYDKPAGRPCRHLDGHACSIHAELPQRGFPGCTVFDCLGAGQQVTQHTYGGLTWRDRQVEASPPVLVLFFKYVAAAGVSIAIQSLMTKSLSLYLHYILANLVAIGLSSVFNFVANDRLTFRRSGGKGAP